METPTNTDQLFRDKFEHFHPEPPPHIWDGVKAGIAVVPAAPGFFASNSRKIAAAAVILLVTSLGLWMALPSGNTSDDVDEIERISDDNTTQNTGAIVVAEDESVIIDADDATENVSEENDDANMQTQEQDTQNALDESSNVSPETNETSELSDEDIAIIASVAFQESSNTSPNTASEENVNSQLAIHEMDALDGSLDNETETSLVEPANVEAAPKLKMPKEKSKTNRWSHGIYFSPEFILNDFDSVRILPSYALNYEPTYHFNTHWFIRFGAGLSYARERGFAKLDYVSNEVVGSYEDVYDVTFDSIGGTVVPTFHTKTTEVWDSVRHIQVKEVTNQYLYLQSPLLFGYSNQSKKFNWYFYGGPALSLMVGKWIEKPEEEIGNADIVNLENNLPNRSPFYMQLWLGAGIEYKVGKQLSLALEPNYRYHFNQIYDDPAFNTALSGFSLRFGVVFSIK